MTTAAAPVITLRPYQVRQRTDIHEAFIIHHRVMAEGCTGSGKTTLFSAMCQDFVAMGKRVLVIVNRERLVRQAAARIQQQTGIDVDIEMAGEHASPHAMVVVASVPTLMRLNRLTGFSPEHFGLLICDEAHHSGAEGWLRVIRYFHFGAESLEEWWTQPKEYTPHCKVLGVTATPDDDWGDLFQHAIKPYTLIDAVEDGFLVPIVAENIPLKIDLNGIRVTRTTHGSDLRAEDIESWLIPVIEAIADQVKERAGNRKTIIFWPSVKCARLGDEALTRRGMNSFFVSGECIDLHEKTAEFVAGGNGTVLNNAILYCEGADFPDISCVVPARATKQRGFFRQMVGRGTRVLPGVVDGLDTPEERRAAIAASAKPDLLLLDLLWNLNNIDLCDAYDIMASCPEVKDRMKERGELTPENAKESERDFLKALEVAAKKNAKKAARTINPLAFAVSLGESSIADYKPETSAEAGPLTAIQIEYLKAAEFNYSVLTCAGQADKIIKRLETRKQLGLATPKQLSFLIKLGLPEEKAALMKKGQAGAVIGTRSGAWRR
jgi:superfamily II DNA or RNA helicase